MSNFSDFNNVNVQVNNNNLLTTEGIIHLRETVKWAKFFSILSIIWLTFFLISIISISFIGLGTALAADPVLGSLGTIGFVFIFLVVLAFYVYPIYALFKFSQHISLGLDNNDSFHLTEGLRHQKGLFRYVGVITIIIIAFYVLIFLFGALAGLMI